MGILQKQKGSEKDSSQVSAMTTDASCSTMTTDASCSTQNADQIKGMTFPHETDTAREQVPQKTSGTPSRCSKLNWIRP